MKVKEFTYSEETNVSQHWALNRIYQLSHTDVKLNTMSGQLFSSEDERLQKCSSYQVSVFFKFDLFMYLFLAALGLPWFMPAFSICGEPGLLSSCGALIHQNQTFAPDFYPEESSP